MRNKCVMGSMLIAWILWGVLAFAQSAGTITGTVSDSTGAVIPGASVTVRNVETGFTRALTTDERGRFAAPQLPVGNYEVTTSSAGFQSSVRRGITLTVGAEAVVNFSMSLGAVAESIEVTGEAPMLETTTSTVSGLVDTRQMREIPLNARSFIELVPLTAGTAFVDNAQAGSSATFGFGKKLTISGGRTTMNTFLLDGADMTDSSGSSGSAASTLAGVETVREFRVITNAYDAEYGKHAGGVITAVTKSGTNELHGSVFEFFRNDNLDAPSFFDNALKGGVKQEFKRNQYGFSAGGPVIRDKTFFFASYEGLRQSKGVVNNYNVPGIKMRTQYIAQGACAAGCSPDNPDPSRRVDPKILPYLNGYPLPNQPDRPEGSAQFSRGENHTVNQNYWSGRADHRFSDSDFIFGRFTYDQTVRLEPEFTTYLDTQTPNRYITAEETHVFSPQLLGKSHLSFSRTPNVAVDYVRDDFKYPNDFWSFDGGDVPGRVSVSGLTAWGGSTMVPKKHIQNLWQGKQDFYWTKGSHSLKFGGLIQRIQFNSRGDFHSGGTITFPDLSAFLLGQATSASFVKPGSDNIRGWRQTVLGLYLHDDFSVRPGLTLNIGIRYEPVSSPNEVNGKMANIRDFSEPHISQVSQTTTDVGAPYFQNPSLLAFQPRFGFAWSPFGSQKTSLRGGFGVFDDHILPNGYITSGIRGAPFYSYVDMFSRDIPAGIDFPRAYFTQVSNPQVTLPGVKPEFRIFQWNPDRSYLMKWSLDIERELMANMTVGLGYSGSRGVHLLSIDQATNYTPFTFRASDGRRLWLIDQPMRNANFNRMHRQTTDRDSKYHGLRLSFNKRFSQGLQFQTSYTWSKSMDNSSANGSASYASGNSSGDFGAGSRWYGISSFNVPHSFFSNFVYDLPGSSLTGAAGYILGGWSMSGVLRMNSGTPLDIGAANRRNGSKQLQYTGGANVDLIPGGDNNPSDPQNRDHYFDTAQFQEVEFCFNTAARPNNCNGPSYIVQGNVGRNTAAGPGLINMDFTLTRSFALSKLYEGMKADFRFELYNLFNRPNFGVPSTSVFTATGERSSTFGQINSLRGDGRQIQLGLKFLF
ncbi:MAG: TonB-dependent receptor [Acidobacteria bacterium]|nr:TonB-dependent receptor [Acidobacteriota bacterium]